ncbi:MAG: DMT family transporter [Candidimonas sp.]|nr:MAG: DMT family transporter [Candidimonas sp.]TAM21297.1 MAG: DMT family transporter [Candidimonas sp.]
MNFVEFFVLAAIWGASFLFMRIGAPELGPIPLIALRVGIAALVLAPILRSVVVREQFRAKAKALFILGVTNSAIPFCLLAYSTLYVGAGFDSILNATTPLWVALIALTGFQVAVGRQQILGLLVGFGGVVILVWETLDADVAGVHLAIAAALLAAVFYGFGINYSKRHLAGVQPLVVAFGSQFFAALVLMPLALFFWPTHSVTPLAWACVAALGIVCTGFAYILFFRLIEHVGSAFAASVTFLIPVFGMLWGAVFLSEKITPIMIVGCAIIVFGTALTGGKRGRAQVRPRMKL